MITYLDKAIINDTIFTIRTIGVGYQSEFCAGRTTNFILNPKVFCAIFIHVFAIIDIGLTIPSIIDGPFSWLISTYCYE